MVVMLGTFWVPGITQPTWDAAEFNSYLSGLPEINMPWNSLTWQRTLDNKQVGTVDTSFYISDIREFDSFQIISNLYRTILDFTFYSDPDEMIVVNLKVEKWGGWAYRDWKIDKVCTGPVCCAVATRELIDGLYQVSVAMFYKF